MASGSTRGRVIPLQTGQQICAARGPVWRLNRYCGGSIPTVIDDGILINSMFRLSSAQHGAVMVTHGGFVGISLDVRIEAR
jgi:hypothetical protein